MAILRHCEPPGAAAFNLVRKFWHMLGLILPLLLWFNFFVLLWPEAGESATRIILLLLIAAAFLVVLLLDLLRLFSSRFRSLFMRFAGILMKEEESRRINATIPYLAANLLLFLFFSDSILILASIFLMLGDPVAALVGVTSGRWRFVNGKSLEGLVAFVVTAFVSGLLFLWLDSVVVGIEWLAILFVGALFAGVAELLSGSRLFGLLDDNLLVPIAGAFALALCGLALGFEADSLFVSPAQLWDQAVVAAGGR